MICTFADFAAAVVPGVLAPLDMADGARATRHANMTCCHVAMLQCDVMNERPNSRTMEINQSYKADAYQ